MRLRQIGFVEWLFLDQFLGWRGVEGDYRQIFRANRDAVPGVLRNGNGTRLG